MGSRVFKNGFISTEKSMLNIEKLGDAKIIFLQITFDIATFQLQI